MFKEEVVTKINHLLFLGDRSIRLIHMSFINHGQEKDRLKKKEE
jgi:hypothetical protein